MKGLQGCSVSWVGARKGTELIPDRNSKSILPRRRFLPPRRRLIRVWCCKRTSLFWHLSAEPCSANGCDFYGSVYGAEYSDWFSFPFPRALLGRNRQTPPPKSGKPRPATPTPPRRQWACLPTPCRPLHRSPATSEPIPRASDASQSLSVYSLEI